jgi:hypothetical protein
MLATLVSAIGRVVWSSLPLKRKAGRFDPAPDHSTSSPQSARCGLKPRYARPGARDEMQSVRDEMQMNIVALFTWMITILAGLILLIIWIIEYDREFQSAAATRLPVPVISAHVLLAIGGLMLWIGYLLLDEERLAWAAAAVLGTVAVLGLIMAARWIRVYRAFAAPGPSLTRRIAVPAERNFPLPVVVAHGILAVTTLVLVLFTALGAGRR